MQFSVLAIIAAQAVAVLAVPVANYAELAKDNLIIKATNGYKRDEKRDYADLAKDNLIIKATNGYKRDEEAKRDYADLAKDNLIIKATNGYKRDEVWTQ